MTSRTPHKTSASQTLKVGSLLFATGVAAGLGAAAFFNNQAEAVRSGAPVARVELPPTLPASASNGSPRSAARTDAPATMPQDTVAETRPPEAASASDAPVEVASLPEQVPARGIEPEQDAAAGADPQSGEQGQAEVAAAPTAATPAETVVRLQPGDTLIELLTSAGADRIEAHNAVEALRPLYNPRALRAGQEVKLALGNAGEQIYLNALEIVADVDRTVVVERGDDGSYAAREDVVQLIALPRLAGAEIDSSLYLAAQDAKVPANIIVELIRAFSYSVDFQREIQPGDAFEVLYDTMVDPAGQPLKAGEMRYAALRLGGKMKELYRFEVPSDGSVDYFVRDGYSVKRMLMRTPVDGARLSSGFGKRRHPILGYNKMHKGVDFAAPTGTPIMAAGDGTIEVAGRNGGYGNYIRIRHNGTFSTAYAHMHRFAKGMSRGARVRQGQIIGYVGSTGRSTGPHLHYEILMNGAQVNPMGVRVPVGRELAGKDLKAFKALVAEIDRQRGGMEDEPRIAGPVETKAVADAAPVPAASASTPAAASALAPAAEAPRDRPGAEDGVPRGTSSR
ncbi:M23 family metallopeptidase [Futiania mangrovi]|uniref:Peptidoglycan DD-metalloendopeptidase family protein n=1 Tax=Futiania mangrovi TaxID=2959716 RepID=A0A9J6PJ79_9PROT|nr:peptidoglycan DD-metalloendopeptidase family protein [Futiania mangrovii]MCP1336130.1 peptidoglycan DD-metalloendopeptidase family protein [Futiania mangrovii]